MPPWPMAMPSSTAIVLNSLATPPASATASATIMPRLRRCTWPGTNWVKLLATATIGLPKSPSVMPVARQSARAPAILRPDVEVFDLSSGIRRSLRAYGSTYGVQMLGSVDSGHEMRQSGAYVVVPSTYHL